MFNVSIRACKTIDTILRALWAFWSDLKGIPPHAYTDFCARLKALMPGRRADGGDVTIGEGMQAFITWVKKTLPAVSPASQVVLFTTN